VTNCAALTVFSAADFVVTNTADSGPGTLRSAINVANVCSGTNVIRLEVTGVINLVEELPAVQNTVIVRGPGPALLTIRRSTMPGTPAFRVLTFVADYAELTGVTIANGRANVGAGLYNESDLFISNCVITANTGLSNGCGAGIFDQGSLTLVDSMVTGNTGEGSVFYGAGIEHGFGEGGPGFLHVTRSVIATNYSQGIAGGLFLAVET
jgi:hypothetical protein